MHLRERKQLRRGDATVEKKREEEVQKLKGFRIRDAAFNGIAHTI